MAGADSITTVRYDLAAFATVDQVISATQFVASALAGFDNAYFFGYAIWVLTKADKTTTAPKGENPKLVTGFIGSGAVYPQAGGTVTHAAFTTNLAPGDTVLLLHPSISNMTAMGGILETLTDKVYFDEILGSAGTEWPIGTPGTPVNNLADAQTIMTDRNISTLVLSGAGAHAITLPDLFFAKIEGNPGYVVTIAPLAIVAIISDLVCDSLVNTTGNVWVYGDFTAFTDVTDGINNIDGMIDIRGNVYSYGLIRQAQSPATTGWIVITGHVFANGGIFADGDGTITIYGNCHGEVTGGGAGSNIDIRSDVYGGIELSTHDSTVIIYGNCISQGISVPTAGSILNIYGNAEVLEEVDVGVTATFYIRGNLHVHQDIYNDGDLSVGLDCFVFNDIVNTVGPFFVGGNCQAHAVDQTDATSTGGFGVSKNLTVDTVHIEGTSLVLIQGNLFVTGLIEIVLNQLTVNHDVIAGSISIDDGGMVVYGSVKTNGCTITNAAGIFTDYGDLKTNEIINDDGGTITIYGNCTIYGNLSNDHATSTLLCGGDFYITEDVSNDNGGDISIAGNATVIGDLSNNNAGSEFTVGGLGYFWGGLTIAVGSTFTFFSPPMGFSRDEGISINATNAGETDFINLHSWGFWRSDVQKLRLKCADPGANTVTVRLYELVGSSLVQTGTFAITGANYTNYFDQLSMFNLLTLSGHQIQITVRASAGGPYVVEGQITYSITRVNDSGTLPIPPS